jgi:hypothetical protein
MRRNFLRDAEIFDRKSKNEGKTPSFEIDRNVKSACGAAISVKGDQSNF